MSRSRRVGPDQEPRAFGRPRKPGTCCYCLRLPPEVAEAIERDARAAGYPTAVAFLRALATQRRPPYLLKHRVYAALLRQLARLATNINQLARAVNAGKAPYVSPDALQDVSGLLRRLFDFLLDPFEPSPLRRKPLPTDE